MGVDRIITAGMALALGTALVCAGPVIASPVAAAEGAAAQVRSTDDIKPTRTGYWRIRVAGNHSSATLVRVR